MPRLVLGALCVGTFASCSMLGYYAQAISGHLELMGRAQSIEERLRDPGLPETLRAKLALVQEIRTFASRELALPDNGSYRRYADLDRPYVVWNVVAAPEFSVRPIESCFPFAGCVAYRGFYRESAARDYAQELRGEGYDVHVGGVPAYSTLGWFDDPVLNTFVHYPAAELARILFHELAHQVAYATGDTRFNESFAVCVEEEGARRWLARHGSAAERMNYETLQQRRREFVALVTRYRERLDAWYREDRPSDEKRAGKARLFAEMLEDYHRLKVSWGGFAGYDRFFAGGANNALLASVATYTGLVPAFRALLADNGGDLAAFYDEVRALARLDIAARHARMENMLRPAAGTAAN